jgi:hypothetical protein
VVEMPFVYTINSRVNVRNVVPNTSVCINDVRICVKNAMGIVYVSTVNKNDNAVNVPELHFVNITNGKHNAELVAHNIFVNMIRISIYVRNVEVAGFVNMGN